MKFLFTFMFSMIGLTVWASAPYARTDTSRDGEIFLQTAIRQLIPADSSQPEIYLVGAIHLANASYYQTIQNHLDSYQKVLFECVSPITFTQITPYSTFDEVIAYNRKKMVTLATACAAYYLKAHKPIESLDQLYRHDSTRIRNEFAAKMLELARTNHLGKRFILKEGQIIDPSNTIEPIFYAPYTGTIGSGHSGLFEEIASLLELEKQGEHIRYTRKHFQWCDLSSEEIFKIANERNINQEAFKQTLAMLDGESSFFYLIKTILVSTVIIPDRKNILRRLLIVSLDRESFKLDADIDVLTLDIRNEHVINEIHKQSQSLKTIGVFFGAAHLQAIEDTLCEKDHYKPGETIWVDAINASY